ncbi:MAG TPA: hypothetical protein PKK94_17045, partial [Leptospiraceae bacterium]|nr:hypothetical protein [Leptospiraceae bacterium]
LAVFLFQSFYFHFDKNGLMDTGWGLPIYFLITMSPGLIFYLLGFLLFSRDEAEDMLPVLLLFSPAIISFLYNGAAFLMKTDYRFLLKDHGTAEYSPSLLSSEKRFKGLIRFGGEFTLSEKPFSVTYTRAPKKNSSGGSYTLHFFPVINSTNEETVGFINSFPFSSYKDLGNNPGKNLSGFLNACEYNVSEKYGKTPNAKKLSEKIFCLKYFPEEEFNLQEFSEKAWPILWILSAVHFFICTAILLFWKEK